MKEYFKSLKATAILFAIGWAVVAVTLTVLYTVLLMLLSFIFDASLVVSGLDFTEMGALGRAWLSVIWFIAPTSIAGWLVGTGRLSQRW